MQADTSSKPKKKSSLKAKVQKFGTALSSMVMPNIAAIIAWGLVTAIFMEGGWAPNATIAKLTSPMLHYLIPVLIGYTGGRMVYDERGALIGAIGTLGVVVGDLNIPEFLGAMIMGPLSAWCLKKFDQAFQSKVKSGFEMIYNNFSSGILGLILAILGMLVVTPVVEWGSGLMSSAVDAIMKVHLLPLTAIIIEPAKVLFLNNAIGNGILVPLGIEQAAKVGKSVLFLLEANPGPGLGILLAFCFFGKGDAKGSAPGAAIIHFFGGIHEIYFPYILMKPVLIVAAILGGMSGTFTFQLFNAGLKAAASPGSIIAVLAMTAKDSYLGIIAGVLVSAAVSFIVASFILKRDKSADSGDLAAKQKQMEQMKAESKGKEMPSTDEVRTSLNSYANVNKIIFACDAGMGSSAMGASLLRDKVKKAGIDNISVTNTAVSRLKDEPGLLVVTQEELAERALEKTPSAVHVSVDNFLSSPKYDEIVANLKALGQVTDTPASEIGESKKVAASGDQLAKIDFSAIKEVNFIRHDQHQGSATMATSIFQDKMAKAGKKTPVKAVRINELDDESDHLVIATKAAGKNLAVRYSNIQLVVVKDILQDKLLDELVKKLN